MGPVDAIPVQSPGGEVGKVAVPAERRDLGQVESDLVAAEVKDAQLNPFGDLREQREVGAGAVVVRTEGVRLTRKDAEQACLLTGALQAKLAAVGPLRPSDKPSAVPS